MYTWEAVRRARNFKNLAQTEQDELLQFAKDIKSLSSWHSVNFITTMLRHTNESDSKEILNNYFSNTKGGYRYGSDNLIEKYIELDGMRARKTIAEDSSKSFKKYLLTLSDITEDEEIAGLRGLSGSRSIPPKALNIQYKVRHKCISALPTIMRLNALYNIYLDRRAITYNIFENITEDQMGALLAPSMLRYTDKVESIIGMFKDITHLGQDAKFVISGNCSRCGKFNISIESTVIRTEVGVKDNYVLRGLVGTRCPFCRSDIPHTGFEVLKG